MAGRSCRAAPDGLRADVDLRRRPRCALLDAAVHLARLVGHPDPRLMVPASVESVRFSRCTRRRAASSTVRRRGATVMTSSSTSPSTAPDGAPASTSVDPLRLQSASRRLPRPPTRTGRPRDRLAAVGRACRRGTAVGWPLHAGDRRRGRSGSRAARTARRRRLHGVPASTTRAVSFTSPTIRLTPPRPTWTPPCGCPRKWPISSAGWPSGIDRHPATLWIITRGVREAVSEEALRQSCLWGLAGVIGAEQPQMWGGLMDIAGLATTSSIARRRCPRCCQRQPSPSWRCATANFSRLLWRRSPAKPCESRCGVVPMRHISSPAAWAHSDC